MGRVAVVTGGSMGIGRHLVRALAEAGFRVAFSYHEADQPAPLDGLTNGHGRTAGRRCDVGDERAVDQFFEWVDDEFGSPDLLVNNAGIQTWSPLLDLSAHDWERVIRTNLTGCFLNTKAAALRMREKGEGGSIVNLGSGCNKLAFPRLVDYTASKGGIEQFTKIAAVELGPFGIRVNCVAPGAIATERTSAEADDYGETWAKATPLGRVGTPADVADTILFFASPASAFVTGQTLWVDGGAFTKANWPY